MRQKHIVIIGNGISGVTTARFIRKNSDALITIISDETDFFYSRTALMYIYMGHMKAEHTEPYERDFWKKNKIELLKDRVQSIDFECKKLNLRDSNQMEYSQLVLALGSKPNFFGWKGQEFDGVQGLYHMDDLKKLEAKSENIQEAVIIGGGLIGVELAEMLHSRGKKVTFLVRENNFWNNVLPEQEAKLVTDHILSRHIDLKLGEELDEIIGNEKGEVTAIVTKKGEKINCQFVGLTIGVSPNISWLKNTILETDRGILINEYLETNIPDVYALGDCAQFKIAPNGRRSIEQVWYTGKMMGECLGKTIAGVRTPYQPGNWYNSAKFFDLEYQTYGMVRSKLSENEEDFYWQHSTKELAIHFVFDRESRRFLGVNTFGIRMRHELMDRWLNESRNIDYVLENLKSANFDPEFFKRYESEIIERFNEKFGTQIKAKRKLWDLILN